MALYYRHCTALVLFIFPPECCYNNLSNVITTFWREASPSPVYSINTGLALLGSFNTRNKNLLPAFTFFFLCSNLTWYQSRHILLGNQSRKMFSSQLIMIQFALDPVDLLPATDLEHPL